MNKKRKMREIVKSPNGHSYAVILDSKHEFFHRQLHHGDKPIGPWRTGSPPEWTSPMLQKVFSTLESQALKSR